MVLRVEVRLRTYNSATPSRCCRSFFSCINSKCVLQCHFGFGIPHHNGRQAPVFQGAHFSMMPPLSRRTPPPFGQQCHGRPLTSISWR